MNREYLVKLKRLNWNDERIAAKLGCSAEEVQKQWNLILNEAQQNQINGYHNLMDYWTRLCQQYNLLGSSLMGMGEALSQVMTDEEVANLVSPNPIKTLENLRANCIILRPFVHRVPPPTIDENEPGTTDHV